MVKYRVVVHLSNGHRRQLAVYGRTEDEVFKDICAFIVEEKLIGSVDDFTIRKVGNNEQEHNEMY